MPKLEFAFLADAAEAEPGRKFYVLGGGVDSIGAHAFPVVHPHLALLIRVSVHPTEAERAHILEIRLIDSDGGARALEPGVLDLGLVVDEVGARAARGGYLGQPVRVR